VDTDHEDLILHRRPIAYRRTYGLIAPLMQCREQELEVLSRKNYALRHNNLWHFRSSL
jgi:hypothetical protein